jgi:hypothetical protein
VTTKKFVNDLFMFYSINTLCYCSNNHIHILDNFIVIFCILPQFHQLCSKFIHLFIIICLSYSSETGCRINICVTLLFCLALNCPSTYFIIFNPPCNLYYLTNATTLHSILSLYPMPFSQILPFCNKPVFFSYDSLFQRSPIKPLFELSENSNNSSLFLHNIFKHSSSVYGLYFLPKKKQTILNFFNEYKRATFITDSE